VKNQAPAARVPEEDPVPEESSDIIISSGSAEMKVVWMD